MYRRRNAELPEDESSDKNLRTDQNWVQPKGAQDGLKDNLPFAYHTYPQNLFNLCKAVHSRLKVSSVGSE